MTDEEDLQNWREDVLPGILSGNCGWGKVSKAHIDAEFAAYTGLEGLRGAFYLGGESCNCEGMIPNEYPLDDPQHKAFEAGFRAGAKIWRS